MNSNRIMKKIKRLTKDFNIVMTPQVGTSCGHRDYAAIVEDYENKLARLTSAYKVAQLTRLHRDLLVE